MSGIDSLTPLSPPMTPHIAFANLLMVRDRSSERDGSDEISGPSVDDCRERGASDPEPPTLCLSTWIDGKRGPPTRLSSGTGRQQPHTPQRSVDSSPSLSSDISGSLPEPGLTTVRPRPNTNCAAPITQSKSSTLDSRIRSKAEGLQDLNGLDIMADDEIEIEDDLYTMQMPMTAAERRAAKRRMKRFRLTHNQTRFLMSEFARQAHPDAAHRERLASEIPGLSPRQVQVWFQNRRAKLKRFTSDDRERVMRSRALPDNFDSAQALHSPFSPATHHRKLAATSSNTFMASVPDGQLNRPHSYDNIQWQCCTAQESLRSIAPSSSSFNLTPPQSVAGNVSPISSIDLGFQLDCTPIEHGTVDGPCSFTIRNTYGASSVPVLQVPRPSFQRRFGRQRAESQFPPLRISASCSRTNPPASPVLSGPTAHSAMSRGLPDAQDVNKRHNYGDAGPCGLGRAHSSMPGFQAASRIRSSSTTIPRRIDLDSLRRAHFRLSGPSLHTPHIFTVPQTATIPVFDHSIASAGVSHDRGGLWSAPHHTLSFAGNDGPHGSVTNYGLEHVTIS